MFDKDMCDECAGLKHDYFEILKYVARVGKWLCAACRKALNLEIPGAV